MLDKGKYITILIENLAELRDRGVITQEGFESAKEDLVLNAQTDILMADAINTVWDVNDYQEGADYYGTQGNPLQ